MGNLAAWSWCQFPVCFTHSGTKSETNIQKGGNPPVTRAHHPPHHHRSQHSHCGSYPRHGRRHPTAIGTEALLSTPPLPLWARTVAQSSATRACPDIYTRREGTMGFAGTAIGTEALPSTPPLSLHFGHEQLAQIPITRTCPDILGDTRGCIVGFIGDLLERRAGRTPCHTH